MMLSLLFNVLTVIYLVFFFMNGCDNDLDLCNCALMTVTADVH